MAKATVTFTDDPAGFTNVNVKFSPPVNPLEPGTPAQNMALRALELLKEHGHQAADPTPGARPNT